MVSSCTLLLPWLLAAVRRELEASSVSPDTSQKILEVYVHLLRSSGTSHSSPHASWTPLGEERLKRVAVSKELREGCPGVAAVGVAEVVVPKVGHTMVAGGS